MYIPFSMSDEPDLGDEFKYEPEDRPYYDSPPEPPPMRKGDTGETVRLFTQEEMTKVIQQSIKNTRDLELKLFYAKQLLNGIYNKSEKLPDGYSQKIREFIK